MNKRLIDYQPMDLAQPAELVAAIRKRRGGKFINLDRMLLHSVPIAEGWNHYIGAIRNQLSLDPKLRELGMCGVAVLNGAEYEFIHHAPPFKEAGGTQEQVEALRLLGQATFPKHLFNSIEQDADIVMFLYREDYYNKNKEEHNHITEVIVSKHRNGPTGDVKVSSQFQYSRFFDIDIRAGQ